MPEQKPTPLPDKGTIATLPAFAGLPLAAITVVTTDAEAQAAYAQLCACEVIGFDTESKPTFNKGEASTGPHVLQFACGERAWLFQTHRSDTLPAAFALLQSERVAKVGFGLKSDLAHIERRFGFTPRAIVDLGHSFRARGYRQEVGAKSAIALLFGQKLAKSKSVGTSNWAARELAERQQLYAANDAYAALCVHHALLKLPTSSANGKTRAPRVRLRAANPDDAAAIAAIYAPYVNDSCISFEEVAPDAAEIATRIRHTQASGLPYLVATVGGEVAGYAYASAWRQRPAYRFAVESSVYLRQDMAGRGLGARLMRALFDALEQAGMHTVIAGIALPNPASVALHEKLGMKQVAQFAEVGLKFGRRIDVGYWQYLLGPQRGRN